VSLVEGIVSADRVGTVFTVSASCDACLALFFLAFRIFFFSFFDGLSTGGMVSPRSRPSVTSRPRRPAVASGLDSPVHRSRNATKLRARRIGQGTGCRRQIKGSFLSNQRYR